MGGLCGVGVEGGEGESGTATTCRRPHILPNTRTHKPTPATLTGLRGFDWAPKGPDNVLAYWAPERGQQPARVVMVELPSKREART